MQCHMATWCSTASRVLPEGSIIDPFQVCVGSLDLRVSVHPSLVCKSLYMQFWPLFYVFVVQCRHILCVLYIILIVSFASKYMYCMSCVCVCVCVCVYIHICLCVHNFLCVRIYSCAHMHAPVSLCVCVYVCVCVCVCVCFYVFICVMYVGA